MYVFKRNAKKSNELDLGIDSALESPPSEGDLFLFDGESVSIGDSEHLMDDVYARDGLRNGVFHLQTSVHLQEVEVPLRVHEELHGACRVVADCLRQLHSSNQNDYLFVWSS